ncbi:hypothetical protein ACVW0P_001294 [Mucilaginibacter sp. UYNi724]
MLIKIVQIQQFPLVARTCPLITLNKKALAELTDKGPGL